MSTLTFNVQNVSAAEADRLLERADVRLLAALVIFALASALAMTVFVLLMELRAYRDRSVANSKAKLSSTSQHELELAGLSDEDLEAVSQGKSLRKLPPAAADPADADDEAAVRKPKATRKSVDSECSTSRNNNNNKQSAAATATASEPINLTPWSHQEVQIVMWTQETE